MRWKLSDGCSITLGDGDRACSSSGAAHSGNAMSSSSPAEAIFENDGVFSIRAQAIDA